MNESTKLVLFTLACTVIGGSAIWSLASLTSMESPTEIIPNVNPKIPAKNEPADKDAAAVLIKRCKQCHSGDKPKGDLDITKEGIIEIRGKDILGRIVSRDKDKWMPPNQPLTVKQYTTVFKGLGHLITDPAD